MISLTRFCVQNFRSILDSGWIRAGDLTCLIGPNESGKSNLIEALYRIKPFDNKSKFDITTDWPTDMWDDQNKEQIVCTAEFKFDQESATELFKAAKLELSPPESLNVEISRDYNNNYFIDWDGSPEVGDVAEALKYARTAIPSFVLITDYPISGSSVELPSLAQRVKDQKWDALSQEEQTIKIILDLAKVDIDDVVAKGGSAEGRVTRGYDLRAASASLTRSFKKLWPDKNVDFDLSVDGTTFNIYAKDEALGMPVRLSQRSTGFRWYVSFAWRFTHATKGLFKDTVLLLEEPGVHLHPDAQKKFVDVLDHLSTDNQIVYTTHLPYLIDPGFPERVRIIERDASQHTAVTEGVVSRSGAPMLVVEGALGISHSMTSLLERRCTLIVEGSMDDQALRKLSALCARAGKASLPDDVHIWPADTASKTPMYAAFLAGHKLRGAVLVDSDRAGYEAAKKIKEKQLGEGIPVLMLADAAGSKKSDFALEDLFPQDWFIQCVEAAYGIRIAKDDLEGLGDQKIGSVVERHLKSRGFEVDKRAIAQAMLVAFEKWKAFDDLPAETQQYAEKLFSTLARRLTPTAQTSET